MVQNNHYYARTGNILYTIMILESIFINVISKQRFLISILILAFSEYMIFLSTDIQDKGIHTSHMTRLCTLTQLLPLQGDTNKYKSIRQQKYTEYKRRCIMKNKCVCHTRQQVYKYIMGVGPRKHFTTASGSRYMMVLAGSYDFKRNATNIHRFKVLHIYPQIAKEEISRLNDINSL